MFTFIYTSSYYLLEGTLQTNLHIRVVNLFAIFFVAINNLICNLQFDKKKLQFCLRTISLISESYPKQNHQIFTTRMITLDQIIKFLVRF